MRALTYVEIDVDYCALVYGTAPCTAAIGVTGDAKCFNTLITCQDRPNFDNAPVTLRFAVDADYLPRDIDCIPSVRSVALTPGVVSLGENLGQRATLTVSFEDHRHSDTGDGFDKYRTERPYDPWAQGTFFGKFRARQRYLRGRPLRLIRGLLGQSLAEMETRHYVIDSFDGPMPDGSYQLIAKDALKLADNERAQAPKLSNGFLIAAITNSATSATLSPVGIGNLEYPASGYVAIGGEEICAFTRSGDVLTLTRGQLGTTAVAHEADDRVQVVLRYVAQNPATIIEDLLETYAGIDGALIPSATWQTEVTTYLGNLYTATIAEPVGVNKLVSELVEQAALAIWWDDLNQIIRLQVLRGVNTDAARFDEASVLEGSLRIKEQPERRLSQVWTYFGQRNPLKSVDDANNYRSAVATVELQAQSDYGAPAIRKIFSRWIPTFARQTAERLNNIVLGRFVDPPRRFDFELFRYGAGDVQLGGGYRLAAWPIQDATGAAGTAPIYVTRLNASADRIQVEAEEMLFESLDPVDLTNRVIIVDSGYQNFNLRSVHDSIYPALTDDDVGVVTLTCIISEGVVVGSNSTSSPAFDVGAFPAGLDITLEVIGRIQGCGGDGAGKSQSGRPGGTALYTRQAINLKVAAGEIWGGGGGGGWGKGSQNWGGGGGAGQQPGAGGYINGTSQDGQPGTQTAGGVPGIGGSARGGYGGNPGLAGERGFGDSWSSGGAAGKAIDGISFITVVTGPGDRRGGEVN